MVNCLSIFVGDTIVMLVMLMNFEHQTFISVHSSAKVPAGQLASCIQDDFASVNFVSAALLATIRIAVICRSFSL